LALRRLERALRLQDPALAALLSGGPRTVLPPLRFDSLSPRAYAATGGLFLVPGMYLGVGSATFAGLLALMASVFRYVVAMPPRPTGGRS
jgi:hypothetical protein